MRTGAAMEIQELRRRIYLAAKSDKRKRFWSPYCHVTKEDVLRLAYEDVKANKGAAGIDGKTFEEVEQ